MSRYKSYVLGVLPDDKYFSAPKSRAINYLRATLLEYHARYCGWSRKRWLRSHRSAHASTVL